MEATLKGGQKSALEKNDSVDIKPYMISLEVLTPTQLKQIFDGENHKSKTQRKYIPQVVNPSYGSVYLIANPKGVPFAHYDNHRWTSFCKHNSYIFRCCDGEERIFGEDTLEMRYNRKVGDIGNISKDATRIIYKFKPPEPFLIVHYLREMPSEVEELVSRQENYHLETAITDDARINEKEEIKLFGRKGRQRKPNSKYTGLYEIDLSVSLPKSSLTHGDIEQCSDQDFDVMDESEWEYDDIEFLPEKVVKAGSTSSALHPQMSRKSMRQKGLVVGRGSQNSGFRRATKWMESSKGHVKKTVLFRMCGEEHQESRKGLKRCAVEEENIDRNLIKKKKCSLCLESQENEEPVPLLLGPSVLKNKIIEDLFGMVKQGEVMVYSTVAKHGNAGDAFMISGAAGIREQSKWKVLKNYHLGDNIACFACKRREPEYMNGDIQLLYLPTEQPASYFLIHFVSAEALDAALQEGMLSIMDVEKDTLSHYLSCEGFLEGDSNNHEKIDIEKSDDESKTTRSENKDSALHGKRKSSYYGRPRKCAGVERNSVHQRKAETSNLSDPEHDERLKLRKNFGNHEPVPYKIFTRSQLYHVDAEDIFDKVIAGDIPALKCKIDRPQYGDIYILDKNYVPFADSFPWVRYYYYKQHGILMERFHLRDSFPFDYPLPPGRKTLFSLVNETKSLCILHYEKGDKEIGVKGHKCVKEGIERKVYTESNVCLNLNLVEAMLANPDEKRIVQAPVLNPLPFQVYLVRLPDNEVAKAADNFQWTDKGTKRWPPRNMKGGTKLLISHCPMKMPRTAVVPALMRHEYKHIITSQNLRVLHYMPTREFREYVVIANAAEQLKITSEMAKERWTNMSYESDSPLHSSCERLKPRFAWELLARDTDLITMPTILRSQIITPQPGGIYLSTKVSAPDGLSWEELGRVQLQPKVYQLLEVCEKVSGPTPFLIRIQYTSPKFPHRVLVHYIGDPRPYVYSDADTMIEDDECLKVGSAVQGNSREFSKHKKYFLPMKNSLREEDLFTIRSYHISEVGTQPVRPDELKININEQIMEDTQLNFPDKAGVYMYCHRMGARKIMRVMEKLDVNCVSQYPIQNPEAGEVYLIKKPASKNTLIDSHRWTHKGWQPIPRKNPVIMWRWGLLRHKKMTWAPPLIRIDYVHLHKNSNLMLVHYVPTRDNESMLETRSKILPIRTLTHNLLSRNEVDFGQHSQLLTNSALPASHVWELLNATGGLVEPMWEPQPGGVYVVNLSINDKLDIFKWKHIGDIRLSANDFGLVETTHVIDANSDKTFARLTYHSPLIKNRSVIHYLGDCRPFLEKDEDSEEYKTSDPRLVRGSSQQTPTQDVDSKATKLSTSCSVLNTASLNQTFAQLGGEVEGMCEGRHHFTTQPKRPEDEHLMDYNLPTIHVPYGSVSTHNIVKNLFPRGLPKVTVEKVIDEDGFQSSSKQYSQAHRSSTSVQLDVKVEVLEPEATQPFRAIPRGIEDWKKAEDAEDIPRLAQEPSKPKKKTFSLEERQVVYMKTSETLTEKQLDHMLCNPNVDRISFLPLVDPEPGDVYVVAVPQSKGELRRIDCYKWYITGHKKGKYRRTYSYIKEEDGNSSHRLLRYTYDYSWEKRPGLRIVHYRSGDPRHTVEHAGKQPNHEEEDEIESNGPIHRAYTASMHFRDALALICDPPRRRICEIPIKDPKAGEVYAATAISTTSGQQDVVYDNRCWGPGKIVNVGGKRPVMRKTRFFSMNSEDGTKSDSFRRIVWERLMDVTTQTSTLPLLGHRQGIVIIQYLGDETIAGEMVRKGKDSALHLRQIHHYLETGGYLPSVQLTEKNGIRKSSRKFMLEDSHMFYVGNEGKEKRLVLYTAEERSKAFDECHVMPVMGEHCGRTKTLRRLTDKYYWTCMVEDVVALIVKCKTCEFNKASRPNQRFFRVTEPWEVVSIDIIGQFTATDRGHAFVAVMIDMFTKYSIAIPVRDTLVADISEAVRQCIFQQGPPKRFISDQSEEFIKELNYTLEVESSVIANIIPVGRAQINRPDEANIKTAVLKWCVEAGNNWDDLLNRKLYEMNTSYLTAAGHTPFYLLYHRHPRPLCSADPIQFSGTTKPAFVVRDVERHIKERELKTTEIINQVLSGQSEQSAKQSDRYVPSTAVEHPQMCEYETAVHIVPDPLEADQDTSQYTHVTHITEGQVS
ncbi:uncharacterized protein LOC143039374 isoform X3 [Oratosquilla oratoria]|uniref:uncharacterized protein LOC143039374 isoform X3 n=1 Tax=Oratosquilla oratoria TaxID=337810 RepID=UPI003F757259